ncbi:MAG: ATP-dependent protease ATPase subunit HslU [Candidatus Cloacimonadales bacterium]|jgi:ATP-dependent HslUV protease ATP-binding subunit HslU|nr:ATP-dependent protease ATPase subunit HslU [Candidatus Cloacimonadota bacterium]MDD2650572.1 ATP-dependent protease ATPase subunit HslU [Candidatus Cloacimonadota bacterium]MDD3501074.1 ATP-dependent protease ATPase subunit HslU [Candidatus Cloacimonadota bacterium]MDX9977864.1 ATP-dependent protease ATPase subunit HslU [Candidatus Cloacimonadales bacterium]
MDLNFRDCAEKKMGDLTPKKIVENLNNYIIGQDKAKKAVAIALRNRWRRQKVSEDMQDEIIPNNIIMIGPTGVGKTEIAKRLSHLAKAPFIKVEASKFTEVGYVGRDVESMVRELMDFAYSEVRAEMEEHYSGIAKERALNNVLDIVLMEESIFPDIENMPEQDDRKAKTEYSNEVIQTIKNKLMNGRLNNKEITISTTENKNPQIEIFSNIGLESLDFNLSEMMSNIVPFSKKEKTIKMKVSEALSYFTQKEASKLVSRDKIIEEAKYRVENHGIIFIDEIDKIASAEKKSTTDVSRSGVQRDLLPIIEGSNVPTKYGIISTNHILFVAAGAFHMSKPSDLIPELQGRFPIRVELESLTQQDFEKILTIPKNALLKQYIELFKSEKVELSFEKEAVSSIAELAAKANTKMEDIGARRLQTIMNAILEDYLFEMPKRNLKQVIITKTIVEDKVKPLIEDEDLSKYIL